MAERVSIIDVGFVPEAAISGPVLLQSEEATFLIFNAMIFDAETKSYDDAGLAVCHFPGCIATKFGFPDDQAWSKMPRTCGLGYDVCEDFDSEWKQEVVRQIGYAISTHSDLPVRHFIILFHESSFECLAKYIETELTKEPFSRVMTRLIARLERE